MGPEEIKTLCKQLGCSTRQLADTLGVSHREVMDWEVEKKFPTKRHVEHMHQLLESGADAIAPKRRGRDPQTAFQVLADPALWRLFRKVLAHPQLRTRAIELAEAYDDPE